MFFSALVITIGFALALAAFAGAFGQSKAVVAVLRHFLFGRIQGVLDARATEEERRKAGIASARKAAAEARAKLDARRAEVEKQVYEQSQVEVRAGLKRKSELVAEAIDKARAD